MNDTAVASHCACNGFPFVLEADPAPETFHAPCHTWTGRCDEAAHRQLVETQSFWYVVTQTLENRP